MSEKQELNFKLNLEDLMDPFTLDWLEEPITLPCCGRAVSRENIKIWQQQSNVCPCCRQNLGSFDASNAPKSVNLSYLVEQAKTANVEKPRMDPNNRIQNDKPIWIAKIHKLYNQGLSKTAIGRLELETYDKKYKFKTLIIPVIDKSGSMSGHPTLQVKYSLNRIIDLIYTHNNIITNFVTYNDNYNIIDINRSNPIENNKLIIENMHAGGGTSFSSAFSGIIKVIDKFKDVSEITSIVIIFLTDGEDGISKDRRIATIDSFKNGIDAIWKKKYIVHSIGFGSTHDAEFLNALRQVGTTEGAYRYADPIENPDSLSGKINSILDVVAESSSVPIKLIPMENSPNIIFEDNDKYWLNLTNIDPTIPIKFKLSVNNDDPIDIQCNYTENDNEPHIWDAWFTYLIDQIANEIIIVTEKQDNLDRQIHCELLEQRSRAIISRINYDSPNAIRLNKLMEVLKSIKKGDNVNIFKLNDLKYEGQYATKISNDPKPANTSSYLPSVQVSAVNNYQKRSWDIINLKKERRVNATDNSKRFLQVIGRYNRYDACAWARASVDQIKYETDDNDNNMLMVASMIGRIFIVNELIDMNIFDINKTNDSGYTALDLAIIYGYWITTDILVSHGAKINANGQLLLRTCISNGYYRTAQLLLNYNFATVTDDMIYNAHTSEATKWLSNRVSKVVPIETAIIKGMYDVVCDNLNNINKISWNKYLEIFSNPSNDHMMIVKLLLDNNKADPDEQIEISDEGNKGFTWPLFQACEKGQYSMFKLLMKYSKESIDRQNHKGTTILWISCCNRHTDIVGELLNIGANPNITNFKGDGPLIPSCQKGNETIVDMLIESGAKLDAYNKNRDNPVLICCRTGQAKILDRLLKTLDLNDLRTILNTYAEIDGFVPLLASVELDKVECIKVCVKYGADIETRVGDDNKMIPGGTSLHLACFYGRISAAKCLVELGANINSQTTIHGYTPIHLAIKQGHINMVRYLLSLPDIRNCMEIEDYEGRTPSFYAKSQGNETMYEEFFFNKLASYMGKILYVDPDTEKMCSDTLVRYGRSPLCYEYNDITKININDGATVLTYALLNGNHNLLSALQYMGADWTKSDDYGVTPQFWAEYIGYKSSEMIIEQKTLDMINKVISVSKKSMQNKILTNLQSGGPKTIEYHIPVMNSLVKMTDGYGVKVNNNVLEIIKGSISMDHSLLGFIDKLKHKKEFPDGADVLSYLIWDAKINLIKRIAAGTNLDTVHMLAIYLYTGNEYVFRQTNLTLLNWHKNSNWHSYINCLYQAISLLEPYQHEVYRAVDTMFNVEDYAIGNKLSWNTFSVCSTEWKSGSDLINQKRGIVFIINSRTGKNITKYSQNPANKEVIFLPGTQFIISAHYCPSITALGQANIRNTTFKIKDTDYVKACKSEASIIIELTEINENVLNNILVTE